MLKIGEREFCKRKLDFLGKMKKIKKFFPKIKKRHNFNLSKKTHLRKNYKYVRQNVYVQQTLHKLGIYRRICGVPIGRWPPMFAPYIR
jgi:hypothetical protein